MPGLFLQKGVGTTFVGGRIKVVPSHNRSQGIVGERRAVTLPDYRSHRNPLAGHCRRLPDLGAETLQSPYRGEPQGCVIGPRRLGCTGTGAA
jgi:hypothetical protein